MLGPVFNSIRLLITFLNSTFSILNMLFFTLCLILLISEEFAGLIWYFCSFLQMVLYFLIDVMFSLFLLWGFFLWVYIPWKLINRKSGWPVLKGISISSYPKDFPLGTPAVCGGLVILARHFREALYFTLLSLPTLQI